MSWYSVSSAWELYVMDQSHLFFLCSYGRVYAADPYHHTLAPAPTYGVGAMVSSNSSLPSALPPFLPALPPPAGASVWADG